MASVYDTVVEYLQTKYKTIPGIASAPTEYGVKIPPSHLPFAWSYVETCSIDMSDEPLLAYTTFTSVFLIFPLSVSASWGKGAKLANELAQAVMTALKVDPQLGGTVKAITDITFNGSKQINWWDEIDYYAFTIGINTILYLGG